MAKRLTRPARDSRGVCTREIWAVWGNLKLPLLGKISCRLQKLQKKETKRGELALHDIINTTVIICKPCMIP